MYTINKTTKQAKPEQKAHLLPDGWLSYWAVGSKPGCVPRVHLSCTICVLTPPRVPTPSNSYCGIVTYCKPALEPLAVYTDKGLFADEPDDKGELGTLGTEGRLVVTEHSVAGTRLVIFNTYCPNAGGTGRPRLPFKLRFLDVLYRQSKCVRWVIIHGCVYLNVWTHLR